MIKTPKMTESLARKLISEDNDARSLIYPIIRDELVTYEYSDYDLPFPNEFLFFEKDYLEYYVDIIERRIPSRKVIDIGCDNGIQSYIFEDYDYIGIDCIKYKWFRDKGNYINGFFQDIDLNFDDSIVISNMSLLRFQRTLCVFGRVPDGRPAGDLASRARRGGHADPFRLRRLKRLFLNHGAQGVLRRDLFSIQAAERFSHIHHAASAHRDHRLRTEIRRFPIEGKQLLQRGIGGEEDALLQRDSGKLLQSGNGRKFKDRLTPGQHQNPAALRAELLHKLRHPADASLFQKGVDRIIVTVHCRILLSPPYSAFPPPPEAPGWNR